jgi:hypothetical protein
MALFNDEQIIIGCELSMQGSLIQLSALNGSVILSQNNKNLTLLDQLIVDEKGEEIYILAGYSISDHRAIIR